MTIFDDESAVAILVETVLCAKRMEAEGKIETDEQHDLYAFAGTCAEIAQMAWLTEGRSYRIEDNDGGWSAIYPVIEEELLIAWGGKRHEKKRWVLYTGKDKPALITKYGEDDYDLYLSDEDWAVRGTMESVLAEIADDRLKKNMKYIFGGAA